MAEKSSGTPAAGTVIVEEKRTRVENAETNGSGTLQSEPVCPTFSGPQYAVKSVSDRTVPIQIRVYAGNNNSGTILGELPAATSPMGVKEAFGAGLYYLERLNALGEVIGVGRILNLQAPGTSGGHGAFPQLTGDPSKDMLSIMQMQMLSAQQQAANMQQLLVASLSGARSNGGNDSSVTVAVLGIIGELVKARSAGPSDGDGMSKTLGPLLAELAKPKPTDPLITTLVAESQKPKALDPVLQTLLTTAQQDAKLNAARADASQDRYVDTLLKIVLEREKTEGKDPLEMVDRAIELMERTGAFGKKDPAEISKIKAWIGGLKELGLNGDNMKAVVSELGRTFRRSRPEKTTEGGEPAPVRTVHATVERPVQPSAPPVTRSNGARTIEELVADRERARQAEEPVRASEPAQPTEAEVKQKDAIAEIHAALTDDAKTPEDVADLVLRHVFDTDSLPAFVMKELLEADEDGCAKKLKGYGGEAWTVEPLWSKFKLMLRALAPKWEARQTQEDAR